MTAALGCSLLLGFFVVGGAVEAVEELVVGQGGLSWTEVIEESAFLSVASDSIWQLGAEEGQNLGPGIIERGGRVLLGEVPRNTGGNAPGMSSYIEVPELLHMLDGDRDTAFNPAEAGVPRDAPIYIDLGGPFRIVSVRLFPRLDRDHESLFLQSFELGINSGKRPLETFAGLSTLAYRMLMYFSLNLPNQESVLDWPGLLEVTGIREGRYILLRPLTGLPPWEIAELEIHTDGTAPAGTFLSQPLLVHQESPLWGRVRYEGGSISNLPLIIQARTGPTPTTDLYFIETSEGRQQVSRETWLNSGQVPGTGRRQAAMPNPAWSSWRTLADDLVQTENDARYLQFRLRLTKPGIVLRRLVFEYDTLPLVQTLQAEVYPAQVEAGQETAFTLSLLIRTALDRESTGLRYIRIATAAAIAAIDSVRVGGRETVYTVETWDEEGFTINFWRRLVSDGTLVQVFFRGAVFVDGTPVEVRAFDRRFEDGQEETASQFAREGDVDPLSLGATLNIRLGSVKDPLIADISPQRAVFTPNGDGANDIFEVSYSLLRLIRPAPVWFEVFDLTGRLVHRGRRAGQSGFFTQVWNGRDENGWLVAPGLYVYRLRVQADVGEISQRGTIGVVY
ncbi:MAG: hypothetical protein GKR89_27495 [Candidatus Latescibacteria bacterium]|nr:hypothetical protein [Candidatus Latescibacterota bacterium]